VDFFHLCGFAIGWLFELGWDALDYTPHNGVPVASTVRFKFSFDLQGKPATKSNLARTRWQEEEFFTVCQDEVPDEMREEKLIKRLNTFKDLSELKYIYVNPQMVTTTIWKWGVPKSIWEWGL
jgi:hypothetical protein